MRLNGLRIFTNVVAERKKNARLYDTYKIVINANTLNINKALKITQKALDCVLEIVDPTSTLQENIMALCGVQQKASEIENELNWVIKFYRKMDNSNLDEEYMKDLEKRSNDILKDMLASGKCVKAAMA